MIPFYWGTIGTVSLALFLFFIWPNDQSSISGELSSLKNNNHPKAHYSPTQNNSLTASKTNIKTSNYTLNHPNFFGIHLQANHYSAPVSNTLLNSSVQTNIEIEDKLSLNKISQERYYKINSKHRLVIKILLQLKKLLINNLRFTSSKDYLPEVRQGLQRIQRL